MAEFVLFSGWEAGTEDMDGSVISIEVWAEATGVDTSIEEQLNWKTKLDSDQFLFVGYVKKYGL